jgi:TonB family protein
MTNGVERCIALSVAAMFACCLSLSHYNASAATAICQSPALQSETANAEQHIQKAREAIAAERYDDAKIELKIALKLDEKSATANLCLAFVYKQENKPKDAFKHVEAAIKSRPNYPDAHYLLAQLLFEKNDLAKSRQEIDLAISQGATFRNAHILSGDIHLALPNYKSALECYETALRLPGPGDDSEMLRRRIEALANNIVFASHRGDPSYVPPRMLNAPRPVYSEEARNRGVEGKVLGRLLVDEQGRVSYFLIISGPGYGLNEEAVKAVRALRFTPAKREGKPVPYWLVIVIEFNLRFELRRIGRT